MKAAAGAILKRWGFRSVLVVNSFLSSAFIIACASFSVNTPIVVIVLVLLVGGFFRSLRFTSINAIAYAEVRPEQMSRATSLAAVGQQLALSTGVALGAAVVELVLRAKPVATITIADFPLAFAVVGIVSAASALVFVQLPVDAGAELAGSRRRLDRPSSVSAESDEIR